MYKIDKDTTLGGNSLGLEFYIEVYKCKTKSDLYLLHMQNGSWQDILIEIDTNKKTRTFKHNSSLKQEKYECKLFVGDNKVIGIFKEEKYLITDLNKYFSAITGGRCPVKVIMGEKQCMSDLRSILYIIYQEDKVDFIMDCYEYSRPYVDRCACSLKDKFTFEVDKTDIFGEYIDIKDNVRFYPKFNVTECNINNESYAFLNKPSLDLVEDKVDLIGDVDKTHFICNFCIIG